MLNSVVEPVSDREVGATINLDLASYPTAEVEVVSDGPDWIELRVSGEMKAVLMAEVNETEKHGIIPISALTRLMPQ